MSKYDSVLPKLPALPVADQSYQDKIDRVKETYADVRSVDLAETYEALRESEEQIKTQLSAITLRLAAIEQLLAASQEQGEEGWGAYGVKPNALRLATGATIRVNYEPSGQVRDKEAFRLWCLANGYERQLQLWPSTMNALVKERTLAGEPPPDGTEVYVRTKVTFTKSTTTDSER